MANMEKQDDMDLTKARMPLGPIVSAAAFIFIQLIGLVWYFAQMDSRVSKMEFDIHALGIHLDEIRKRDQGSQIQALELKHGALQEKVINGRSRSADSVLILQKEVELIQYRLFNIEQSVAVQVR